MIDILREGLKGALRACRTRDEMRDVWKGSPTWLAALKEADPKAYAELEAYAATLAKEKPTTSTR